MGEQSIAHPLLKCQILSEDLQSEAFVCSIGWDEWLNGCIPKKMRMQRGRGIDSMCRRPKANHPAKASGIFREGSRHLNHVRLSLSLILHYLLQSNCRCCARQIVSHSPILEKFFLGYDSNISCNKLIYVHLILWSVWVQWNQLYRRWSLRNQFYVDTCFFFLQNRQWIVQHSPPLWVYWRKFDWFGSITKKNSINWYKKTSRILKCIDER